ncbi:hypothetical protein KY308_04405, partial [Candidatus Woesearchaeota archaeon]|nr:hypothetical protein [Candidatus Woesearchaeota archaeon]
MTKGAKKSDKYSEKSKIEDVNELSSERSKEMLEKAGIPKEVQEKLKEIKEKLDKFQKDIVKKFDKYIIGVALLPPLTPKEMQEIEKREGAEALKAEKEK